MINNLFIVGRLTEDLEIEETEGGIKILTMPLAVGRPFKNTDGKYETDIIPVRVIGGQMRDATAEYCKKGDVVGVKGRLQSKDGQIIAVADKVTFLTTRKEEE